MSLGVLTFVFMLGNLINIANLVINKGVDIWSVSKLFVLMIPYLMIWLLPMATLIATLLSMGRFSSDNEIIAIRSSGINIFKLILPLLIVGLILSLILVVFNDRVVPYAHFATRKTLVDVGSKNPAAALEPGVFINSFEKYVLFIYRIEENKLFNVRIYQPEEGKPTRTIVSKRGEFIAIPEKNMVKLKLIDGTADEPDPENPASFYKLNFKTYFIGLNLNESKRSKVIEKKPKDMTIAELKAQINALKAKGIDPTPIVTELYQKISIGFACFVFILLGSSLAIITRRREKSINFGISFVIVGIYYLLFIAAETLSSQGIMPPQITMWLPNILFALVGAILTFRLCAS